MPFGGDKFAAIPGLISMVRSYIRRDYSKLPKGTILAIIGALIYFSVLLMPCQISSLEQVYLTMPLSLMPV